MSTYRFAICQQLQRRDLCMRRFELLGRCSADPPQPLTRVAFAQRPPPVFAADIPVDGLGQTAFEAFLGAPTELPLHLRGIDRIAAIMPRAILDEGDQLRMTCPAGP